jgi:pyrroline-5-carboxylate reductase
MTKMKILLVGCGKMGGALLARWQALGLYDGLCIVEPSPVAGFADHCAASFKDIPSDFQPDAVVFAVKPQILEDIAGVYRGLAETGALMLSIAAGKKISFFENYLGTTARIVRAMPNTPAAIGKGMTVACANVNVSAVERAKADALLSSVGDVLWVEDEALLNPVTALSGSGPAYVFLLIEMLEKAGVHIGLDPVLAGKLARQTVIGSAALAEFSPDVPAQILRANVTSPGGTTQAALDVLMSSAAQDIFNAALLAATQRAEDLAG